MKLKKKIECNKQTEILKKTYTRNKKFSKLNWKLHGSIVDRLNRGLENRVGGLECSANYKGKLIKLEVKHMENNEKR